jgi:hypothetical protein
MRLLIGWKLKEYLVDKFIRPEIKELVKPEIEELKTQNNLQNNLQNNYIDISKLKNDLEINKKFEFKEPETIAKYRLENKANDKNAIIALQNYKKHKIKIRNQWVNALQSVNSGYGTAQYSFYNYQTVNYYECYQLAQDPIMNNIFEILSNTPLSKSGTLQTNKTAEQIKELEKQANKFRLKSILRESLKSSFVSGGCLVYIDFGLDNLEEELDLKDINYKRFRGFKKIDPINMTAIDVNTIDPASADYMSPSKWYVIGLGVCHKSHFVKFAANEPENILKPLCLYFGMPLTQLLKRDIANTTLASQSLANLLNRFRYLYLKTNEGNFSTANAEMFRIRLEAMNLFQDNYSIYPIKDTEDIQQLIAPMTNFYENVELFFQILSAITSIPLSKLLGVSAKGLNATGEGDRLNFYDKIKDIQENILKANLLKMYEIINYSIEGKYERFEDYIFNSLEEANEKERGELINKYIEAGKGLVELGAKQEDIFDWLKQNKDFKLANVDYDTDTLGLYEYEDSEEIDKKEEIDENEDKNIKSSNEFKESEHPRDKGGKFIEKGSEGNTQSISKEIFFGEKFEGYKGQKAIEKLLQEKKGYVPSAFTRQDIGDIDLVWGDEAKGLKHIIKRRIEQEININKFLEDLSEVIEKGNLKINKDSKRFEILFNQKIAVIDFFKDNKDEIKFLLTAFRSRK